MKRITTKSMVVSSIVFLLITASIPLIIISSGSDVTRDENNTSNQSYRLKNSWYIADGRLYSGQSNENIRDMGLNVSINDEPTMIGSSMNSPWPMLSHDLHHTGQSPYSTVDNPGDEKWQFKIVGGDIESSAVIDNNGTIYFGSMGGDHQLYALYPNGTKKWSYYGTWIIWSTPAIDENGVIYVDTTLGSPNYLHAVFTDNGTLKWKYPMGGTFSSPVVADDGTIVFGDDNYRIIALYPNGTEKWQYTTGNFVASSAAIGDDGMIYIGSSDGYLYALYPNGTLCWKFGTGGWIKGHPSIAEDGTIYVPSFDGYLYALYPNGTMKWRADTGSSVASAGAVIATDGTVYAGTNVLRAFYPNNGTLKWSCDVGDNIYGTVPAISADGTIYVSADHDGSGGSLVAVNPNGTMKWSKHICNQDARSSPCIGEDGTVYVGSSWVDEQGNSFGYLHAINNLDPNAPSAPQINGQTSGKAGKEYECTFKSTSPLSRGVYYYIEWGDGTYNDWTGPYTSGQTVTVNHTWNAKGTYTIKARAKDTENLWGPWGTLTVAMPRSRTLANSLFLKFLEHFPLLEKLLNLKFHYNLS